MTTLADINETLAKQTQVLGAKQTYTSHRVDSLANSFNNFFDMIKDNEREDLEAEAEANRSATSVNNNTKAKGGGLTDFLNSRGGIMDLLPLASAVFRALLTTGLPAAIGVILADEIGEFVTKLTGSQLLGSVAEWGTMGGAVGFLFGGVKGGLLGAAIGAIFSEGARDKYAEIIEKQFGLSAENAETGALFTAAALSAATLLLPTILPKIMPMLLGPAGLIAAGALAVGGLIYKYSTDPEFKKTVDAGYEKVSKMLQEIVDKIKDWLGKKLAGARDALADAGKSMLNKLGIGTFVTNDMAKEYSTINPEAAAKITNSETGMAELVGTYGKQINSDFFVGNTPEAKRDKARFDALKKQYEDFTAERLKYFKNRDKNPIRKEDLNTNKFAMSDDGGDFSASSSEETKAAQDKRIAIAKEAAKPKTFIMPNEDGSVDTITTPAKAITDKINKAAALSLAKPVTNNGATLTNAIRDMRGPDAGYINAVDASTTNNISNPTQTTYVGETRPSTSNGRASSYGFDWGTAP